MLITTHLSVIRKNMEHFIKYANNLLHYLITHCELHTYYSLNVGLIMDYGLWIMDYGLWIMDSVDNGFCKLSFYIFFQ